MKNDIVLVCVDEAHVSLPSQWGHEAMREDMYLAPSYLRAQVATGTKAPVLAMTASAKIKTETKDKKKHNSNNELEEIKKMCGIQFSDTTLITISPILHNHLYVNLMKPPSLYGFYGKETSNSSVKIGSVHILWRIYLKRFVSDIKKDKTPKRAILYVKKYLDLADLDEFLTEELGRAYKIYVIKSISFFLLKIF